MLKPVLKRQFRYEVSKTGYNRTFPTFDPFTNDMEGWLLIPSWTRAHVYVLDYGTEEQVSIRIERFDEDEKPIPVLDCLMMKSDVFKLIGQMS